MRCTRNSKISACRAEIAATEVIGLGNRGTCANDILESCECTDRCRNQRSSRGGVTSAQLGPTLISSISNFGVVALFLDTNGSKSCKGTGSAVIGDRTARLCSSQAGWIYPKTGNSRRSAFIVFYHNEVRCSEVKILRKLSECRRSAGGILDHEAVIRSGID